MPTSGTLQDGVAPAQIATVAAFHNTDNQSGASFAYGLLTGGVAQLINVAGNLDRARETSIDNVSAVGISSGSARLASPISTTITANVATGSQTVAPAAMSGTSRGAAWAIQPGTVLTIANSNGSNSETVFVTAIASTTFTATFATSKTGPAITVEGWAYNQEKDASIGDGVSSAGIATATEYGYNGTTFDAGRTASAANVGAANGIGVDMVASPGMWTVLSTPSISTQATASKTAGSAGVIYVATAVSATVAVGASAWTPTAPVLLNLRNGATGAGTIIGSWYVTCPAAVGSCTTFTLSGLSIPGSAATAMTLEFAAASTLVYQSVTLQGYTTQ
jgi:hypothetical protein